MNDPDRPPAVLPHDAPTRPRMRAGSAVLTTLVGLGGCAASNGATPIVTNTARVIVRFAPDVTDPADAAFLAALATSARVGRIELIRPMSGDAYVMRIVCDDAAQRSETGACDAAIARVGATASVRMIELDGRETTR